MLKLHKYVYYELFKNLKLENDNVYKLNGVLKFRELCDNIKKLREMIK